MSYVNSVALNTVSSDLNVPVKISVKQDQSMLVIGIWPFPLNFPLSLHIVSNKFVDPEDTERFSCNCYDYVSESGWQQVSCSRKCTV